VTHDTLVLVNPAPLSSSISSPLQIDGHNITMFGGSDGSITLNPAGGTPPYSFAWSNGSSTQNLSGLSAGTYSVVITDANGCVTTQLITLDEPYDLEMPTGYSPNNDGYNDAFVVHGIEAYPDNHLQVFNRWGNLVYDVDDYKNTWQGTGKTTGGPLPDGTYFVILTINSTNKVLKGYVDLRR
jgi:gliding motility-associated-like protein